MTTGHAVDVVRRPVGDAPAGTRPVPALVRVVVVTYYSGDVLGPFLSTLHAATSRRLETVVVDNGSADRSAERVVAGHDGVRVVQTGANLGYGAAANTGATGADSEWLLVANPDVTFEPGSLDLLLEASARWPGAGAFGPLIRTPDGALYPSARALPDLPAGIGHALAGWWWPGNPWTASYRRERGSAVEGPTGWLSGACLLVRRDAFEAVGGFDSAYFMYFEDLDLCDRLGEAGWSSVYAPGAVVTHDGAHATRHRPRAMVLAHHLSAWRYLSGRYRGLRWAPVRVVLAAGLLARCALAMAVPGVREGAQPTRRVEGR